MSEWTPEVGDKVMLGERGPFYAGNKVSGLVALYRNPGSVLAKDYLGSVPTEWLTPAPEPEPEEPTAHGALVRDGDGNLFARDDAGRWVDLRCKFDGNSSWHWGHAWQSLSPRPITVILADPAEVETLRAWRPSPLTP